MDKKSLVFKTEDYLKQLSEKNMKLLFSTHGFRLLGIVTWDRMLPDESLGIRRRWIKGLVMENGVPLSPAERIFETSLHRKNPKTGHLEDIVVHEDGLVIISERKGFDLSDDESNFQFMPNMHMFNRIQQMQDEIEEGRRRLIRIAEEKEQALLDTEQFKRSAILAKEREKTQTEFVNRLSRENGMCLQKIGNLESALSMSRARNMEYEATIDELTANAVESGTIKGMTNDDRVLHAVQKKKELHSAMLDIESSNGGEEGLYEELDTLRSQIQSMSEQLERLTGRKQGPVKQETSAPVSQQEQ